MAKAHSIPFYIAAPSSTFDLSLDCGDQIPIEERKAEEITNGFGRQTAPTGVAVYNPAFDVTPAEYISAIITEKGIVYPPYGENLGKFVPQHEIWPIVLLKFKPTTKSRQASKPMTILDPKPMS